jgi:2-oxoglutarate dehydrogenase E1 component
MFTQPIMYRQIMSHAPVVELYSQKLIAEGLTTREAINEKMIQHNEKLEESYAISR